MFNKEEVEAREVTVMLKPSECAVFAEICAQAPQQNETLQRLEAYFRVRAVLDADDAITFVDGRAAVTLTEADCQALLVAGVHRLLVEERNGDPTPFLFGGA